MHLSVEGSRETVSETMRIAALSFGGGVLGIVIGGWGLRSR